MDLDVDRFIFEIENHPAIWNMKCDAYSDRVQKVKQWEEVINEFIDQNASVEEKKNHVHLRNALRTLGSQTPDSSSVRPTAAGGARTPRSTKATDGTSPSSSSKKRCFDFGHFK